MPSLIYNNVFLLLLLLRLNPASSVSLAPPTTCAVPAPSPSLPVRRVRFWVGANGAGGASVVDRATNASCTPYFLGNLSKYAPAVSSLGFEVWTLGANATGPVATFNDGSSVDVGLGACVNQLRALYPHIAIGLCGATSAGALGVAARQPADYVAVLRAFFGRQTFTVDEVWTDFEVKSLSAGQTAGVNAMHALTQKELLPTFRYAGCEPRDSPYFSENCSAFVDAAPGVVVQASNTYWSTTVSSGWYKGFAALLQQEIDNIGGASHLSALSPSICPACATGGNADDALTMEELYARMDIVCAQGISDFSAFTFFEIVQGPHGVQDPQLGLTLSDRYFEALSYYRWGVKGRVTGRI